MQRILTDLTDRQFDVLIVGGGICGLTIACDAAQRGLSVALVERHDFGSGTSFNHLRTIHGGLRYLQHLDLARARESVAERRTLAAIAPWAVQPMPFVLPLGSSLSKGPLAMRTGFLLDRIVARDRNKGLPSSHVLATGQVTTPEEATERFPALKGVAMSGAAVWWDYVASDADRLTFGWADAAARHGAVLANYVEALSLLTDNGPVAGVAAVDHRTGQTLTIRARAVVNATGSVLDRLLKPTAAATGMPVTKAMNLVTSIEVPPAALGGRSMSGRNFFMVPWRGRAVFGTWESGRLDTPGDTSIEMSAVSEFVEEINRAFPSLHVTAGAVTLVHRGVVPAATVAGPGATPDGREHIHDHAMTGHPEMISVAGTKYTTARAVAEKVTTRLMRVLGRSPVPCRTATTPLPAPPFDLDVLLRQAARQETVVTLEDAVVRRTPVGAQGRPSDETLTHAANVVGAVLGWDESRRRDEIAAVARFYESLQPIP